MMIKFLKIQGCGLRKLLRSPKVPNLEILAAQHLRWLNTVFDTCVSITFFSKTLDPSVVKNGSKQVNNTNFGFLMVKLTDVPLPWQHE